MFKRTVLIFSIFISLTTFAVEPDVHVFSWRYGSGSNIDIFCTTRVTFFHQGKITFNYPGGGCNGGVPQNYISEKKYYWGGGGGLPVNTTPVPDKASIEMVSFHDSKRYRITVDLPSNLEKMMKNLYRVEGRYDRRDRLYFGLAPGGYYEVVLMGRGLGVSPDIMIKRGMAEEVTDEWYDKKVSIAEQYGTESFDKEYGESLKKHPIPTGMEWAPIMDAYRAKQPKTDQHPVE